MRHMSTEGLAQARDKMAAGGVHPQAVDVFTHYYQQLESGETGMIAEADVEPMEAPPKLGELEVTADEARAALDATAIIRLNGGLGTSMGMDRAKSLLEVRDGRTFLDIIAGQVSNLRTAYGARLPLLFMNSFRTRDDTLEALSAYPDLAVDGLPLDFLQNREPKLRADDLTPVKWPADPSLEWCPPGHGDLYTALHVSGVLQALVERGFRYASVSNSDNLGAVPSAEIAGWFAGSGAPYAAEVCRRTPADIKGGYLVVRRSDGRLVLRETAQTPPADVEEANDITRHRYFHTNNLWFDLFALAEAMQRTSGVLGLPLIRNVKTVDPGDAGSPEVVQIESAMGAAVEIFDKATAVEVDRSRFLPVKTTNDLLVLRSNVYEIGADCTLHAVGEAPRVDLDGSYYKLIDDFDRRFAAGAPSLVRADSLTVRGDWTFGADVQVVGAAVLEDAGTPSRVQDGATVGRG